MQASWHDLQLFQGGVRVDGPAERFHVLRADLGEVLHRLDVLTADVTDALETAIGKGHVVLAGLLRLLFVDVLVVELVHGVDGLGLRNREKNRNKIIGSTLSVLGTRILTLKISNNRKKAVKNLRRSSAFFQTVLGSQEISSSDETNFISKRSQVKRNRQIKKEREGRKQRSFKFHR